jgi:hypothetical protein
MAKDTPKVTDIAAEALSVSRSKSYPWAIGYFSSNTELSLELWTVIAGISGFDD